MSQQQRAKTTLGTFHTKNTQIARKISCSTNALLKSRRVCCFLRVLWDATRTFLRRLSVLLFKL